MTSAPTPLYCLGCGRLIANARPDETLAITCACGASAPILMPDLNDTRTSLRLPASLIFAVAGGKPVISHIEYYLGWSDFTCLPKEAVIALLRQKGAISFAECSEEKCLKYHRRKRQEILENPL